MEQILKLDIVNLLVFLATFANILVGLAVFAGSKDSKTNFSFFAIIASVSMWGGSMFFFRNIKDPFLAATYARVLYLSAALIPFSFFYFVNYFNNEKGKLSPWSKYAFPLPLLIVTFLSLAPDYLISAVRLSEGQEPFIIFNQPYHIVYATYIIMYFGISYIVLFYKLFHSEGVTRAQIRFILIGTFITTAVGLVTNLIMPFYSMFSLNWVGQIGVISMVVSIAYSIFKHHLFDAKIVFTELLSFLIIFILLVELLMTRSIPEAVIKGATFAIVCILLYWLIKSVVQEVTEREKVEKIAKELETANTHLKVLDQQKSEFVSIASHQLRTPLTAIRGYSSMILEGSFGPVEPKAKEAVDRIFQSSGHLVDIVEDFLNITRIEQGRLAYQFSSVNLKQVVTELVEEAKPRAANKKQTLELLIDEHQTYQVTADEGKIRQVISNLIDNAIKYTPEKGAITVALNKDTAKRKVLVSVKDNGIGMSPETLSCLFQKFSRAEGVRRVYTEGIGIGLYVASEMMKEHHGRIWAESEGEGKGSAFFVELLAEE